jgi:uncharacterized membrane protein YccF (DUF307 family)
MPDSQGGIATLERVLYFLLVGWWAALVWGLIAYACCATIVLLPVGTTMFNRLPYVLTLKPVPHEPSTGQAPRELPLLLRIVWFFAVGWWLGLLLFKVGYILCVTIVLLPLGVWLLHRVPVAMTLCQAA